MNNLALFVTHNIFFDQKQIKSFLKKDFIKTKGVSVPVWVNAKTSKTTEPAQEVFCEYEIFRKQEKKDILLTKKGYKILLSNEFWTPPEDIDFEKLAKMTEDQRREFEEKRNKWWKKNPKPFDIEDLQKTKYYRLEIKKLNEKFDKLPGQEVDCQHIIEIKTKEMLVSSLS
jgi:hypothetical protein